MRFKGLDLNLLRALDLLLEERNVSRAAERMNICQSGMSGALSRLRQHFSDELLVSVGRRLIPTPLAETMHPALRDVMDKLESLVDMDRGFDPRTSQRKFRLEIPDYLMPVFAPSLLRHISQHAPSVLIEFCSPHGNTALLLQHGDVDLAIAPEWYGHPDFVLENLAPDQQMVIGWEGNPFLQTQPDMATIERLKQVVIRFDRQRLAHNITPEQLSLLSGDGRTAFIAPNFSTVASMLIGTEIIAILHHRLVRAAAARLPLIYWETPIPMPSFFDVMMYLPTRRKDEGLAWIRQLIRQITDNFDA